MPCTRLLRPAAAGLALAALCVGCAATGAVPKPFPTPQRTTASAEGGEAGEHALKERVLVQTALALRGTRYRNGGSDPQGFDCSGFTQYVFARHGMTLPREVRDQFGIGRQVRGDLAAGDLLFFTTAEPGASHVAISMGGDEFVHAPSSRGVVRVEHLSSRYWARRFLGARRITRP